MHNTTNGQLRDTHVSLDPAAARFRILSGSLTLLVGSGLSSLANLVYNIAIARLLGPTGFAHATAVYTLLMLMSAITLSFQIVCAKLVANHASLDQKAGVYVQLHRSAWLVGAAIGLLLLSAQGWIASYLNLPNRSLIVLLAVGTAFYIPLGARRGGMQGIYAFQRLAVNFILEGLVRLGGAYLLIKAGMGVNGAVVACMAAVVVAYLFGLPGKELGARPNAEVSVALGEGVQAIVFFAGQVIINNFDIVLVKHFFSPEGAGLYAAVALVGRVVNMCAWSVASTMLPVSAGRSSTNKDDRSLLFTSQLLVFWIVALVVIGLRMTPDFIWRSVFGAQFEVVGYGSIASLLVLYAMTTGIYSLGAVIIVYEMSRKIASAAWLQLAFSGALVAGIYFFHHSLRQVILVQLELMIVLLSALVLRLIPSLLARPENGRLHSIGHVRTVRALSQEQVIAEFLKNEFHHPEFDRYRARFERIVTSPDLNDPEENALRKALLFLRRARMWRELPADTLWFEIEMDNQQLSQLRVFPRAQWRKIAQGSFYLDQVVARVRDEWPNHTDDDCFSKLHRLSLVQSDFVNRTVLLIGVDANGPLTILDGNHRVVATTMMMPSAVSTQFHFICGFSQRMTECCWYQTNLTTLWRYGKNVLKHLRYDPESEIGRFFASSS